MRISYLSSDVCSSDLFAITRHPMMWGLALWALAHTLVMPTPAQIILSATISVLALVGSAGQDARKARLMRTAWRHWAALTLFVPCARPLGTLTPWGVTIPPRHPLARGLLPWPPPTPHGCTPSRGTVCPTCLY